GRGRGGQGPQASGRPPLARRLLRRDGAPPRRAAGGDGRRADAGRARRSRARGLPAAHARRSAPQARGGERGARQGARRPDVSAESKAPSHAPSPELDRAVAFAKAVLHRKLTSKEHAEECVRIARDAARRGKTLPIEEVFVRKGYLRRPEAQAVLKALDKEPKLELAENVGATPEKSSGRRAPRAKCPNCDKDPGHLPGECERCGTDLATGGPGPHATICTTCSRVVKRGSAVCPRCATPLSRDHHRKFNRTKKDTA